MATFDVIAWMSENGHPGYASEIARIRAARAEGRIGEAAMEEAIEEVERAAHDRYDDWASDPLP